jgi:hypothetical protein
MSEEFPLQISSIRDLQTRLQRDPRLIDKIRERPIAELAELGVLRVSDHVDVVETGELAAHLASHPAMSTAVFNTGVLGGGGVSTRAVSI